MSDDRGHPSVIRPETRHRVLRLAEEQARSASARATRQVALRRGRQLGMYIGCGFPKSGTVWLCQLLGSGLDLPFPRHYQSPLMMAAVVHAHWRWDARLPPTAYIRRDGRDVMVSMYFHYLNVMDLDRNPLRVRKMRETYERVFGTSDPRDVRANLPRFIELQSRRPIGTSLPWQEHILDWWGRPGVSHLRYEDLLADSRPELTRVLGELTGEPPNPAVVDAAVTRYDFRLTSGRPSGSEDNRSLVRKGVAGDWTNHFTREAGEVFDALAGEQLVEFGYAEDRHWYEAL